MKPKDNYKELENAYLKLQKKMEKKTREVKELKTSFLLNVCHEIRTPMNAIIGFSNLLANPKLSENLRDKYLNYINISSEKLLNLIDDLLEVSQLETGYIHLDYHKFELNNLFIDLYKIFESGKQKLEKEDIALLINLEYPEKDITIVSDSHRISQVISNLLDNALKFTDKGIVEFGYYLKSEDLLQIYVADSGKGGLVNNESYIFDSFTKMISQNDKNNEGMGLGLRITKGIVNLMGGKIWVQNNQYKGSTFNILLPIKSSLSHSFQMQFEDKEAYRIDKENTA